MQRARDRGLYAAPQVVTNVLDCVTGAAGIASAASVVAVLHPILLVLLVIAELPGGWAAVRAARIGYITNFALADSCGARRTPTGAPRNPHPGLLPVVPATSYAVADRAEQDGYQAKHQHDDPDRPDDGDLGDKADNQQDDSECDHGFS
jgi:hypothetical protein